MIDRSAGYVDLLGRVESILDTSARGARQRPNPARTTSRARVPAGTRSTTSAARPGAGIQPILEILATLEVLGAVILERIITQAPGTPVAPFAGILAAAGEADRLHAQALDELGGQPITTRFWIPDALLAANRALDTLAAHQEVVVSAYLTAIGAASRAHDAKATVRLSQMLGTACEHRALARFAAAVAGGVTGAELPNDRAFQRHTHKSPSAILAASRRIGFGLGEAAVGEGAFHQVQTEEAAPGEAQAIG